MPRSAPVLVLALVLLFASPALPASARADADNGVQVDPDSAPAAEYALPLDAARRAAVGSSEDGAAGDGAGGGAPSPAFGSGISPKPTAAQRSGSRARKRATPTAEPGAPSAGAEQAGARADTSAPGIASDGGDPILYSLGGSLAVLVAGGLVALTLRRRQSTA